MASVIKIPIIEIKPIVILNQNEKEVMQNQNAIQKILSIQSQIHQSQEKENIFLLEQDKQSNKELFSNCIKVFTNRLGTKIVPYWEFPNGCWDKMVAENLGLLNVKSCD